MTAVGPAFRLGSLPLLLAFVSAACTSAPAVPTPAGSPSSVPSPAAVTSQPLPTSTSAPSSAVDSSPGLVQEGGSGWQATATRYEGRIGEKFVFHCPPDGVNWFVYGTDVYTNDSSVCTAAVHVGLITLEAGGDVVIEIRPGQDAYVGSSRNDISSQSYGSWPASFVFVGAPVPAQTSTPAAVATPAPPTPAPSTVADTPAPSAASSAELVKPGSLLICLSYGRTRFAELDADGNPFGVDVEIGQGIAATAGVAPVMVETPFEDLIDAVVDGLCDVSIGGQFITQARLELIDMIPYREGTPHVMVAIGNPLQIQSLDDLCGRSLAVVSGTVYVDMVEGLGDFTGAGLDDRCAALAQPQVDLRPFATQADAEEAFGDGDTDAYAGNDFLVRDRPGEFEWAVELPRVRNGIGHRLETPQLDAILRTGLRTMIADGSYLEILDKYGVAEVALTTSP